MKLIKYLTVSLLIMILLSSCAKYQWNSLFDGATLNGWCASEHPDTWRVEGGVLVARGERSHLFYEGEVSDANFKNFELSADVMTEPNSNSGIYFHTQYQEEGWPGEGYECQVFNGYDHKPEGYIERKLTGSLYDVRNVCKSPAKNNEWFNCRILVQGKTIQTYIDNILISEYTELDSTAKKNNFGVHRLGSGTFGLQGHDPQSVVYYKNIKVKMLPDDLPAPGAPLDDAELDTRLISLARQNFPLMDLHTHLKGGLTQEQALAHARKYGFTYGIAVNCGIEMGFETNEALETFLADYERPPHAYLAMQAEGREWLNIFKPETIAQFDYVFTDAMTWTNKKGKRMRLWIPEETEVGDPQVFMDELVENIEQILTEPIHIYVNATYLPRDIAQQYDKLWTVQRMDRVIKALIKNDVALEIGAKENRPSAAFIKRAKKAGVKFTFGTNNGSPENLGRLERCMAMIDECDLKPDDMWYPDLDKKELKWK